MLKYLAMLVSGPNSVNSSVKTQVLNQVALNLPWWK